MAHDTRHNNASQQVLEFLRDHVNVAVPIEEIRKAIGAEQRFTVANAVTHLINKGINIERPMKGMYLYRTSPIPVPEPEMPPQKYYEFVGNSGGVTIVRGEDMELYVVTSLVEFVTGQK